MKRINWQSLLILVVMIASVVYILPTFNPDLWPHKKINLGLDLQGGMHLVLRVESQKAVENAVARIAQEIRDQIRRKKIHGVTLSQPDSLKIRLTVQGAKNIAAFRQLMDKEFPDLRQVSQKEEEDFLEVVYDLPDQEVERIRRMAVDQALETIRNRIDQFGVSEPDIRRQGQERILIQLPGVKDPQRAKDLIGRTAQLEFKLVDEENDLQAALNGNIPPGREILYEVRTDPRTKRTTKVPLLLKKRPVLTGDRLTDARVQINSRFNEPYVSIKFDRKGARIFERVTAENVNKRLAIVLDNTVYSAPVIQSKISGGDAMITGNFTMEQARDLAIVLRAGALPAPVQIIEERTVGPSLGTDSIRMGLISMLVGGLLVIIFMAIYYKLAGLIADVALMLNILLIAAGLAAFQATLTLPGIAGIILTIGMAVDANVLIFERIREELRLGKTPHSAVAAGFDRATLTILDANITTLIAALVLFQFGTGPVKGFAVTLSLGVLASLFTALIVSRTIFDYLLSGKRITKLSI